MLLQHERIWITGAQGQVGSAFARMLDTTELDVLLTDIDEVDITDMDAVRNYAEMYRPDCVINCAGICGPAFCEENSDLAYKVNAVGARNLSVAARSVHAELVQISTDDIFDGRASEPYNEFSTPGRRGVCKNYCAQIPDYPQLLGLRRRGKFCDAAVAESGNGKLHKGARGSAGSAYKRG